MFYITGNINTWTSLQTLDRPIMVATFTGMALGDLSTGLIMGGLLEAIFMGVSGIGGNRPAQQSVSSVFVTALVITTDVDIETALALAMPFGVLANTMNNLWRPLYVLAEPYFEKLCAEGKGEQMFWSHVLWGPVIQRWAMCAVLFVATSAGMSGADALISWVPDTIMNGINAAGSMLPVLGFGILGSMLWTQNKHLLWLMFGFIASTYLRIPTLALAILAAIVAIVILMRDVELHELRTAVPTSGEEDFLDG